MMTRRAGPTAGLTMRSCPLAESRRRAAAAGTHRIRRRALAHHARAENAGHADAPGKTLIFDEVDAGIGGAVADAVGARLQRLAARFQVLCITHLPQIAAYGSAQFRIEKRVRAGRTTTAVDRVDGDERVAEIARMIGGADVSASVTASAREMLNHREAIVMATKGRETKKQRKVSH